MDLVPILFFRILVVDFILINIFHNTREIELSRLTVSYPGNAGLFCQKY